MLCFTDKTSTEGCSDEWSFSVKQELFLVSFLMVAKPSKPELTFRLSQKVESNEQNLILSNRWLSLLLHRHFCILTMQTILFHSSNRQIHIEYLPLF